MTYHPTLPASVKTPKDIVDSVAVRPFPVCGECRFHVKAGGVVIGADWFHDICINAATGRNWR